MSKTHLLIGIFLLMLLAVYSLLFLGLDETPIPQTVSENNPVYQETKKNPEKEIAPLQKRRGRDLKRGLKRIGEDPTADVRMDKSESEEKEFIAAPQDHPKYIEEIKEKIYERNIESVDQIALLDELVETGDKDTREFWGDGWTSVDDWKKSDNGFKLEKKDDGAMVFNPDEATASKYTFFENPRDYTYDEVNKEFVNEVDYYGKTIYNVAKFINDDVLVMMTISGTKVDLNIYQKNAGQQPDGVVKSGDTAPGDRTPMDIGKLRRN